MATTNYPASLDAYPVPNNGDTISVSDHWLGPAVIGIETELGTDPAGSHANVKDRLDQVDSAMGFKNRIIGGNFSTNPWQRGTSFTGPVNVDYTADRFQVSKVGVGVFDIDKTADAPTVAEAGVFTQHCFHADVTTIDSSLAASDLYAIQHVVEGYNSLDFGFGQSGTRYVTLSFWHKHTVTGTYSVSFVNSARDRSYVAEYTQSTTNTWEKAELTIPVDTSGTWLYDNNEGLRLYFAMAIGSTYAGAAGSWSANDYRGSTNQVNALATLGNDFKIALVQLEAGDKATRFETRSVGQELELCQRYFQVIRNMSAIVTSSTEIFANPILYKPMRSTASFGQTGVIQANDNSGNITQSSTSISIYNSAPDGNAFVGISNFSGLTANRPALFRFLANTNGITAAAEL